MIFNQAWRGAAVIDGAYSDSFNVTVPGDIQKDYAEAQGWGDLNWMDNCKKYEEIEDYFWSYTANIEYSAKNGERVFFVTEGIEYEYDVILNGKVLLHHEGMFSKVEIDITDELTGGNALEILIYPHPKREGAVADRTQADQSCKPAVGYLWDWHPRLLVSGLWDETYIETRSAKHIDDVEVKYTLSDDLASADVCFDIKCADVCEIVMRDMDGNILYSGSDTKIHLDDINLWWCRGQGVPYLYSWTVKSSDDEKSGKLGFKKVRLVMSDAGWNEPTFPKSRAQAPITVELNGRTVFAKGSNWVNPDIFTGNVTAETYRTLITYAAEANMNILRCWGGANVDKEAFFDICDELGIMVWQEFPLACNNYIGTPKYLAVLEQEARAIIKRVRRHACHVIWCGGNELFNSWSGMTEQSHALRLLDKICYEEDFAKPFIMTAPLNGMGHGYYQFYDPDTDRTVFEIYRQNSCSAYSEFGNPSLASMEQLRKIFDEETLSKPDDSNDSPWVLHHALKAWQINSWGCFDVIDRFFGEQKTLDDYVEKSNILQCEGYKCIFEEARRQKPACAMAMNWDYNEPWRTAAGNNLIEYPLTRKPSYYAVQSALRDVMPSARAEHFSFKPGEVFSAELWLLNDSTETVEDTVEVYFTVDGVKKHIMTWHTGKAAANENIRGHKVLIDIPNSMTQLMTLTLEAKCGVSEYRFLLKNDKPKKDAFIPTLNF